MSCFIGRCNHCKYSIYAPYLSNKRVDICPRCTKPWREIPPDDGYETVCVNGRYITRKKDKEASK